MSLGTLLIIDPQNDFHSGGPLAVPGADEDSERIAELIESCGPDISEIIVTLDSHTPMHIANSRFWVSGGTEKISPSNFTTITREDIDANIWLPALPSLLVSAANISYQSFN